MAISKTLWEKARGYYEAGLSLADIKTKTGIDRSTISKKAKSQQWQHGRNTDYIKAKELIVEKKSTENQHLLNCADEVADENIANKEFINSLTKKNLKSMKKKINKDITIIEHKAVQETIDKGAITLGVAQRHATTQINNTNAQQNNTQYKSEEEVMQIVSESLPD